MSGFGYAIAGALEGWGKGIVSDALAARDHAFREAEAQADHKRALALDDHQNKNLSAREQESRTFQAGEAEKNRAFESSESEKRSRQYLNDDEGNLNVIQGDQAKPVLRDGKPVKSLTTGKNETDFDKKMRVGLEIYGGDRKKAAEFAAGVKEMPLADRMKTAAEVATKKYPKNDLTGKRDPNWDEEYESILDALGGDGTERKPKSEATTSESPKADEKKSSLPTPKTKAEFDALPSGTVFMAPDGQTRVKP